MGPCRILHHRVQCVSSEVRRDCCCVNVDAQTWRRLVQQHVRHVSLLVPGARITSLMLGLDSHRVMRQRTGTKRLCLFLPVTVCGTWISTCYLRRFPPDCFHPRPLFCLSFLLSSAPTVLTLLGSTCWLTKFQFSFTTDTLV